MLPLPRRKFLQLAALAGLGTALPRQLRGGESPASPAPVPSPTAPLRGLAAYRHWQTQARRLLEPLAKLFRPGHADLALAGPASANGAAADRLESFARPMLLAAHYLQSEPESPESDPEAAAFRTRVAAWFRAGLVAGTTPGGPQAWGPDANYHQLHVEMGLVALTLQIAPDQLWQPLSPAEKTQVGAWLATARHTGYVDNNHYFMAIHILEFLRRFGFGESGDDVMVDEYFSRLEAMHRGGGWFQDGINQSFDYYNAYAFNFYGLWWARLHGTSNPARATRWREWARSFTADYEYFFAASGEHPAFGRSITYRFNNLAPFGLAVALNCTDVPLGRLRRLCTRNLDFFLSRPICQEQGVLAIGWTDRFDASAELYTGAASPYWAAKGLSPLLLPSAHAFWHEPEAPLLSETGDQVRVIKPAGLLVRSTGGEVEILNAGSQISHLNLRYGAWKWSKTAYRTGTAFTCAFPAATAWSPDSALTIRLDDGRTFGRHATIPLALTPTHIRYSWALGYAWRNDGPPEQLNVGFTTGLWWHHGWVLQVHRFEAAQPVSFRLGGYSLPLATPACERPPADKTIGAWAPTGHGTCVQPLTGFTTVDWDERLNATTPRTHLATPYHVTPIAVTAPLNGRGVLAALTWTGRSADEAQPWQVQRAMAGAWDLVHPTLGAWTLRDEFLPALSA